MRRLSMCYSSNSGHKRTAAYCIMLTFWLSWPSARWHSGFLVSTRKPPEFMWGIHKYPGCSYTVPVLVERKLFKTMSTASIYFLVLTLQRICQRQCGYIYKGYMHPPSFFKELRTYLLIRFKPSLVKDMSPRNCYSKTVPRSIPETCMNIHIFWRRIWEWYNY